MSGEQCGERAEPGAVEVAEGDADARYFAAVLPSTARKDMMQVQGQRTISRGAVDREDFAVLLIMHRATAQISGKRGAAQ